MEIEQLQELVKDKTVCVLGSVPPPGWSPNNYELIIRCNDWWAYDEGPGDILFHIGASNKIKVSWLFSNICKQLQLVCLFEDGADAKKIKRICSHWVVPITGYSKDSKHLKPLRSWFENRGSSPSTGLIATYTLIECCKPHEVLITGANLYCHEPEHDGWYNHNPLGHVYWYKKLAKEHSNLILGRDLWEGIEIWEKRDADCNNK